MFAAVRHRILCSASEPVVQHGGGGLHGNRGLLPVSTSVRFLNIPVLPATNTICCRVEVEVMEVVHSRCAGLDISKKDARVCVRVAGAGRRRTLETVTTWSSMTNQVLALREHLIAEQVTCVVMEATGDYWKPFYYLLEDLEGAGDVGQRSAREEPPGPQD